jgi:hypothetical protein
MPSDMKEMQEGKWDRRSVDGMSGTFISLARRDPCGECMSDQSMGLLMMERR